jgi:ribosome-associated heat shock protein Hsp15
MGRRATLGDCAAGRCGQACNRPLREIAKVSTEDDRIRVDKWLWAARFFKTRSIAAEALDSGRVLVNGARVKRARALKVGDELRIRTPSAEFTVQVQELHAQRSSPVDAARLFTETEDSRRLREEAKLLRRESRPVAHASGRPTKRTRRLMQKLRGEFL